MNPISAPAIAPSPTPLPWRSLGWILLIGWGFRAVCIWQLSRTAYFYPDEESYLDIGRHILAGQGYVMSREAFEGLIRGHEPTTYWGALTPQLSALLQHFLGDNLFAIRLVLGSLSLAATFSLLLLYARHFCDRFTLLLIAWAMALYPNLHFLGSFLMTETLFLPLVLGCLVLLRRVQTTLRWRDALLLGVCFALAHLTRPVLIPFEFAILGWIWWRRSWNGRWLALAAVCLLATGLTMSPWLARNYRLYGRVTVETKSEHPNQACSEYEQHHCIVYGRVGGPFAAAAPLLAAQHVAPKSQ